MSTPVATTKKNTYISNAVDSTTLRKYQLSVLNVLSDVLKNSFGPYGSNTCIKQTGGPNVYTKDGHTILCNLKFTGIIEESIRSDIESITSNVANTVGDGTTSAVILSYYIFKILMDEMGKNPHLIPADIIRKLNSTVQRVKEEILKSSHSATIDDIRRIAYISSNGNDEIATIITNIYNECGMNVFIDVAMSTARDTSIKYYDGMTLDTGYSDSCFVTNTELNTCEVSNPKIYFFEDPIDTKELGVFFDAILSENIMMPIKNKRLDMIVPTVIVSPRMSRDMCSFMDTIVQLQANQPASNKLPVVLITNTHQISELKDICKMCGAKPIHKYIDREIYEHDVENGLAPTVETINQWAGSAEQVVAYPNKTKFITPANMKDPETGEYTTEFKALLEFLETELNKAVEDGEDAHTVGTLKRRIHSLKSNLVEIYAGGMTVADRDSMRHLLEDAVKNCRSAAINGVGWAANFSGFTAIEKLKTERDEEIDDNEIDMLNVLYEAYYDLIVDLYNTYFKDISKAERQLSTSREMGMPINLRTMNYDGNALSSIESDVIIMESVAKIVGIMVTCNQFLTPNPQMNVYTELMEV